jgi:endonuclease/exonuclease/phosphatase family metal-dependent hydrolase
MIFLYNFFMMLYIKILDMFFYFNVSNMIIRNNENITLDKKKFKILTYNVDGLFWHFNSKIINKLISDLEKLMDKDIDIICLQEVWHFNLREKIMKIAKNKFWNIAIPSNKKRYLIGENSGLLTLSRLPILKQEIYTFNNRRGACALTYKSAQYLTIEIYKNKTINMINTHLQSSHLNYFQDFKKISLKQINEIIENSPFQDFLLTGDLNLNYDYLKKNLCKDLNFFENYKFYKTYPGSNEHLDHFIYKNEKYNFKNKIEMLNMESSDHYPLLIEMYLT